MPIYFNLAPGDLPLTLESIGNHWDQEDMSRPCGYPYYHWLQTEQGCGAVSVNKEELYLPEGNGILIGPGIPHAYCRKTPTWRTAFATFKGTLGAGIGKIIADKPIVVTDTRHTWPAQAWVDRMIAAHQAHQLDPVQLSIHCYTFLIGLIDTYTIKKDSEPSVYHQYVKQAIQEIESNLTFDITVHELVEKLHISPQYLSRLFNRFFSCSTHTYIINYRLSKAKELLTNRPDLSVQTVAHRVGFQDASHFISLFKKHVRYTPLGFRKLHWR